MNIEHAFNKQQELRLIWFGFLSRHCQFLLRPECLKILLYVQKWFSKVYKHSQGYYNTTLTIAFWVGTAENFSLEDSNESKKLIGTPELKTNFSLPGTIFPGIFFVLINHVWLCAAKVSQPQSKLLRRNGIKSSNESKKTMSLAIWENSTNSKYLHNI